MNEWKAKYLPETKIKSPLAPVKTITISVLLKIDIKNSSVLFLSSLPLISEDMQSVWNK